MFPIATARILKYSASNGQIMSDIDITCLLYAKYSTFKNPTGFTCSRECGSDLNKISCIDSDVDMLCSISSPLLVDTLKITAS